MPRFKLINRNLMCTYITNMRTVKLEDTHSNIKSEWWFYVLLQVQTSKARLKPSTAALLALTQLPFHIKKCSIISVSVKPITHPKIAVSSKFFKAPVP